MAASLSGDSPYDTRVPVKEVGVLSSQIAWTAGRLPRVGHGFRTRHGVEREVKMAKFYVRDMT